MWLLTCVRWVYIASLPTVRQQADVYSIPSSRSLASLAVSQLFINPSVRDSCNMWLASLATLACLWPLHLLHHELQGELVIIDVSQSVDLDHPKALDFLREDCKHINDFFR